MSLIHIGNKSFELIHENRNGWNLEAFRDRYSEVLDRYDFIIGDWGYNQLRLKGFFRDHVQKANKDNTFSSVSDYINEYCNFGCAYFILEKKHTTKPEQENNDETEEEAVISDQAEAPEKSEDAASLIEEERSRHYREAQAGQSAAPVQEEKRRKHDGEGSGQSRSRQQQGKGESTKSKRDYYYRKGQRFKKGAKSQANNEAAATVEQS